MTTAPTPIPHHHVAPPRPLVLLAVVLVAALAVGSFFAVRELGGSSSTLAGSGIAATQTRTVPAFAAVDLMAANDVTVRVGHARAVTVNGDDNLIRYVTTEVHGRTLAIGATRGFTAHSPLSVEISVPSLDAVRLSGAGVLTVHGVRTDEFAVHAIGFGLLAVDGTVKTLEVTLSGTGDVRLQQLAARDVTAVVSGAGSLQVDASRSLDATVAGIGSIVYTGNPAHVATHVSGLGSIVER